jgi:hypothetical protein
MRARSRSGCVVAIRAERRGGSREVCKDNELEVIRLLADDTGGPLSDAVVLVVAEVVGADRGRQCAATQEFGATDLPPRIGTSERPLHGPAKPT